MFPTPQEAIAYSLRTSKLMFHRFIDDLKPEEFLHRPCLGANCAAWIVGHLARTDRNQLKSLRSAGLPEVSEPFLEQFAATRAAATGTTADFGPPQELVRLFDLHRDLLTERVKEMSREELTSAPPWPSPLFTDWSEALLFMGLHTSMHMGQLSMIRRSLGRPPVA
jgi:uncharacterized damage-inducible protein DinB